MILALDPSLCCTGWVLAPLAASPIGDLLCGAITTEPESKKRRLYQAEDDAQRGRRIAVALRQLGMGKADCLVTAEQPGGSQSARGASALKLTQGIILGIMGDQEVRWVLANDAKVALCGRKGASKDQMVEAATRRWLKMAGNKPACEAMADAFGVLLASGLWRGP